MSSPVFNEIRGTELLDLQLGCEGRGHNWPRITPREGREQDRARVAGGRNMNLTSSDDAATGELSNHRNSRYLTRTECLLGKAFAR
jgi:hypothetical protein